MMLEREPKYWTKTGLGATFPSQIPHGLTRTPHGEKGLAVFYSKLPISEQALLFGGFPGFARLS